MRLLWAFLCLKIRVVIVVSARCHCYTLRVKRLNEKNLKSKNPCLPAGLIVNPLLLPEKAPGILKAFFGLGVVGVGAVILESFNKVGVFAEE